jgi:AraC-like DNA-binding protein
LIPILLGVINIIAVFQLLFFSSFLILKRWQRPANRFLALFLVSQALGILHFLCFIYYDTCYTHFPHLFYLGRPFALLWGPTLYFYVAALAFSDFTFKKIHALHFLPFFCLVAYLTATFYLNDAETKRTMLSAGKVIEFRQEVILGGFGHLQIFGCVVAALAKLRSYRRLLEERFSSVNEINLSWLRSLLYAYIVAWLLSLANFSTTLISGESQLYMHLLVFLIFLFFFNYIVYKALSRPELFVEIEEKRKYGHSQLDAEECNRQAERLIELIEREKPYLQSDLKIADLAKALSIPAWMLSQVINQSLNQSFFDLINRYRIDAVKGMLSDPTQREKTVSESLYEAGFNSKSAFNKAFKKYTGVTPSQFKKRTSA